MPAVVNTQIVLTVLTLECRIYAHTVIPRTLTVGHFYLRRRRRLCF